MYELINVTRCLQSLQLKCLSKRPLTRVRSPVFHRTDITIASHSHLYSHLLSVTSYNSEPFYGGHQCITVLQFRIMKLGVTLFVTAVWCYHVICIWIRKSQNSTKITTPHLEVISVKSYMAATCNGQPHNQLKMLNIILLYIFQPSQSAFQRATDDPPFSVPLRVSEGTTQDSKRRVFLNNGGQLSQLQGQASGFDTNT